MTEHETTIGEKISPILVEIEDTLWEFEANRGLKPGFTKEGFRAALKIFMAVMMDKIWELQTDENIDMDTRCKMVQKCGEEVRQIVKRYTNIDPHDLYKVQK